MCITFFTSSIEKRSTSASHHLSPSGCLYGGAPTVASSDGVGSRAEPFGHPRTDFVRSGSGPLRVTSCNLIFTKKIIFHFFLSTRPRPRFFAPRTFCICPRNSQNGQQKCGRGGRGVSGGNSAPPSTWYLFLRLFRTIFSFLRNCAVFWIKFELFSRKS